MVEILFSRGLVKVLFATETFAMAGYCISHFCRVNEAVCPGRQHAHQMRGVL